MPVSFERYTPEDRRIDLTEETNAPTLLSFLVEHPDVGFTPAELYEQTNVPRGTINPTDSNAPTRPSQGRLLGGRGRRPARRS